MTFLIKTKLDERSSMKLFSISSSDNQSFVFLSAKADERKKKLSIKPFSAESFSIRSEFQHFSYLIIQLSELNNNSSGEC